MLVYCPDSRGRRNTVLSVTQRRRDWRFRRTRAWRSSRRLARRAGRSGDRHARGRAPGAATVWSYRSGGDDGEVLVKDLGRGAPSERLARPAVECVGDGGQIAGAVAGEIGALGEVLPEQPVGVLVGAALPGALRVAEVHLQPGGDSKAGVLGQLGALVPGQRAAKVLR